MLLQVENVVKHFAGGVRAVDGASLNVERGETLSLVGETGCGKSTLARCIARLTDVTSGRIVFDGTDVTHLRGEPLRVLRRRMQIVFQDPFGSLNPRHTLGAIIGEPFVIHGIARGRELAPRVAELMQTVGLDAGHAGRYPHEFSGGQLQRASIARAIALRPELIVCDEPVSSLDVSIRAQILNLMGDLQRDLGLAYLFISHDLSVVRHMSDRVAVMYEGQIVETASTENIFERPQHSYTRTLLGAMLTLDPKP